jgi:hypothetical protein
MSFGVILRRYGWSYVFVISAVLLAILANVYLVDYGISYREVIVALGALAAFLVFVTGYRGLKMGLVFLVVTFGLGYRTIHVTDIFKIHPSEFVIWGLLGLLIVQQGIGRRSEVKIWLPRWLILFIPFWIWAWLPGLRSGRPWDLMFNEFRNFALLVPLFIVTEIAVVKRTNWRHVLLTFYGVGTWIAALGVLEYLFPGIKTIFPAFITQTEPHVTSEGFARATFSFWGHPAATFTLVLTAPLATVVWRWWSMSWQRVLTIIALALQVFAVYIGGFRSMWLVFGIELVMFAILRRKPLLATVCLLFPLLGSWLVPAQAQERAFSLISLLAGNPEHTDTSGIKRWGRITDAITMALDQPLGNGWAASGWVHNDFIQVAANLGVLAGLLFAGAFLFTFSRLWRRVSMPLVSEKQDLGLGLLLSFAGAGAILETQGVEVLPQLILPVWFVWVLVEVWLRPDPKFEENFRWSGPYILVPSN